MRRAVVDQLLVRRQQIDEESAEAAVAQDLCDVAIARAETARSAAVGEENDASRTLRNQEIAFQRDAARIDADEAFVAIGHDSSYSPDAVSIIAPPPR